MVSDVQTSAFAVFVHFNNSFLRGFMPSEQYTCTIYIYLFFTAVDGCVSHTVYSFFFLDQVLDSVVHLICISGPVVFQYLGLYSVHPWTMKDYLFNNKR